MLLSEQSQGGLHWSRPSWSFASDGTMTFSDSGEPPRVRTGQFCCLVLVYYLTYFENALT